MCSRKQNHHVNIKMKRKESITKIEVKETNALCI